MLYTLAPRIQHTKLQQKRTIKVVGLNTKHLKTSSTSCGGEKDRQSLQDNVWKTELTVRKRAIDYAVQA